jgi:NAD(P)-dependent dehydrogenase (short-subunit alcohol dehydrogenase family)
VKGPPKRILITGAASGIGLETARGLSRQGHRVIIADRNVDGGEAIAREINAAGGSAEFRKLDLGDLARVRVFSQEEIARKKALDVLINNAGLLPPVARATTADGFELGFGVAYLGHFALTGLLLPALRLSSEPRVVSVSSLSHANGRIDFDDLQLERGYHWSKAYEASKLACLVFARELNRRVQHAGGKLLSVAAHPGISRTPIGQHQETSARRTLRDRSDALAFTLAMRFLGQPAAKGAEPLVYAATSPNVVGGRYYGPTGFLQARGRTGEVQPGKPALDASTAVRLWSSSERLSGVVYGDDLF